MNIVVKFVNKHLHYTFFYYALIEVKVSGAVSLWLCPLTAGLVNSHHSHSSRQFALSAGQQINLCSRELSLITTRFFVLWPQIWYLYSPLVALYTCAKFQLDRSMHSRVRVVFVFVRKEVEKKRTKTETLLTCISETVASILECSLPL